MCAGDVVHLTRKRKQAVSGTRVSSRCRGLADGGSCESPGPAVGFPGCSDGIFRGVRDVWPEQSAGGQCEALAAGHALTCPGLSVGTFVRDSVASLTFHGPGVGAVRIPPHEAGKAGNLFIDGNGMSPEACSTAGDPQATFRCHPLSEVGFEAWRYEFRSSRAMKRQVT